MVRRDQAARARRASAAARRPTAARPCPSGRAGPARSAAARGRCRAAAPARRSAASGRDAEMRLAPDRRRGRRRWSCVAGFSEPAVVQHAVDERAAGDSVQHLRQLGFHPRALAGGENDDVEVRHAWITECGGIRRHSDRASTTSVPRNLRLAERLTPVFGPTASDAGAGAAESRPRQRRAAARCLPRRLRSARRSGIDAAPASDSPGSRAMACFR